VVIFSFWRFARVEIWLDGGLLLKVLDYSTRQVKAGLRYDTPLVFVFFGEVCIS
jgi:hypothetical protein